jgi:hypothetical protein
MAAPGPGRLPGRSLARLWRDEDTAPDTIVATVRPPEGELSSIEFGGRRYILDEVTGSEELYDFEHDVLERWNLTASDSGRLMLPAYRAALRHIGAVGTTVSERQSLHVPPP